MKDDPSVKERKENRREVPMARSYKTSMWSKIPVVKDERGYAQPSHGLIVPQL